MTMSGQFGESLYTRICSMIQLAYRREGCILTVVCCVHALIFHEIPVEEEWLWLDALIYSNFVWNAKLSLAAIIPIESIVFRSVELITICRMLTPPQTSSRIRCHRHVGPGIVSYPDPNGRTEGLGNKSLRDAGIRAPNQIAPLSRVTYKCYIPWPNIN